MRCTLIALLVLAGCATTARTEFRETVGADGTVTTEYEARAMAGPFGEVEDSVFDLGYQWGGNELDIGQSASRLDNTGQIQALHVSLIGLNQTLSNLSGILSDLIAAGLLGEQTAPPPTLEDLLNTTGKSMPVREVTP